jgi:hypothetical protein
MNGRLERIRDDYQALQFLERTRKKLTKISEEIYHYEPKTMKYRESYSCITMMLENYISAVDIAIRTLKGKEDEK